MNLQQPATRYRFLFLLSFIFVLLVVGTGCATTRIGTQWPSLSALEYNGETKIAVAYNNEVLLFEPANGARTRLVNSEGEVRLDENGNPRTWVVDGTQLENVQFFVDPIRVDDETILLPTFSQRILQVDLLTGLPESPAGIAIDGQVLADVAVSDTHFYIPLNEGGVIALNRETFETDWVFPTDEGVWAQPLLVDDVLYIASLDHFLYALDAETGEQIWDVPVELGGGIVSTPVLHDGHLYVGSIANSMAKVSIDGELIATFASNNWVWNSPVIFDGVLYFADLSGTAYALDLEDMSEIWRAEVAERGIRPSPVVTEDQVIVASRDGRVYWLERATGALIFEREVDGRPEILSDILVLEAAETAGIEEDTIIVGTVDQGRLLAAFTLENGRQNWVVGR